MLNGKTLNLLINPDVIGSINTECEKLNLSDIRLFYTPEYKTEVDVCFIAKAIKEEESVFIMIEAENKIEEKLGCKVAFITEDMLNTDYKEIITKHCVDYTVNNIELLKKFISVNLQVESKVSNKNKREEQLALTENKKQAISSEEKTPFWLSVEATTSSEIEKKEMNPFEIASAILAVLQDKVPDLLELLQNDPELTREVLQELGAIIIQKDQVKKMPN